MNMAAPLALFDTPQMSYLCLALGCAPRIALATARCTRGLVEGANHAAHEVVRDERIALQRGTRLRRGVLGADCGATP